MNKVNSSQLLLLCIARNKVVEAKNLEPYGWTIRHWGQYLNRTNGNDLNRKEKADLRLEVISQIPSMEIRPRNFIAKFLEGIGQVTLVDVDEDLSWYQAKRGREVWEYNGEFELSEPLTEKELCVLGFYTN
jgi:hypothetical protein